MKVNVSSNPCKDCKDRNETCHSKCERYLEWSEKRQQYCHDIHMQKLREIDASRDVRKRHAEKLKKAQSKRTRKISRH